MIEDAQARQRSNYRPVALRLALCAAFLLCGSIARAQSVAFINPGKSDEIYWATATQGMQAVAKSLGMTFEVQYAQREHLKTLEIAREMVARPADKRPEYIVITNDYAVGAELLRIIDGAGVKSFLAYSSIPLDQRSDVGAPRAKYKGWLGSLEPRAEDAGYLTARALIERGKREKAFGPDGKLHMLAIAGDRTTATSIKRNQGMRRAIAEDPRVVLEQEIYAAWTRENGAEQADLLSAQRARRCRIPLARLLRRVLLEHPPLARDHVAEHVLGHLRPEHAARVGQDVVAPKRGIEQRLDTGPRRLHPFDPGQTRQCGADQRRFAEYHLEPIRRGHVRIR